MINEVEIWFIMDYHLINFKFISINSFCCNNTVNSKALIQTWSNVYKFKTNKYFFSLKLNTQRHSFILKNQKQLHPDTRIRKIVLWSQLNLKQNSLFEDKNTFQFTSNIIWIKYINVYRYRNVTYLILFVAF